MTGEDYITHLRAIRNICQGGLWADDHYQWGEREIDLSDGETIKIRSLSDLEYQQELLAEIEKAVAWLHREMEGEG